MALKSEIIHMQCFQNNIALGRQGVGDWGEWWGYLSEGKRLQKVISFEVKAFQRFSRDRDNVQTTIVNSKQNSLCTASIRCCSVPGIQIYGQTLKQLINYC